ncbi:MAG: ABC transporter substrate-binding protein [Oscillospiraceae bacterium]
MKKRVIAIISVVACFCVLLTACGGPSKPSTTGTPDSGKDVPEAKTSITLATNDFPTTVDPHKCATTTDFMVSLNIYEPLVYTYGDGRETKVLADDYTVSEDGLSYVFHIREGVKFQNGDTLTADDVAYSFTRAMESPYMANYIAGISEVKVTADNEVTITLSSVSALFIKNIKFVAIVDKAWVESTGDITKVANGTAVYSVSTFTEQTLLDLKAFDGYWGEQPKVTGITMKYMSDASAQLMAFESGEIDALNVPSADWTRISESGKYNTFTITCGNTMFLMCNTSKAPYDNPLVRQAIASAIDKQAIIDMALDGVSSVADTIADPTTCFGAIADCTTYPHNLDEAKRLMKDAGYEDGFDGGSIMVMGSVWPKMAPVIQSNLKEIGIEVEIIMAESSTYYADCFAGNYDMALMSITTVNSDMADYSTIYAQKYIGTTNMSQYKSDAIDALFEKGLTTLDKEARLAAYAELNEIIESECVYIPLLYRTYTMATIPELNCVYDGIFARYSEFSWNS